MDLKNLNDIVIFDLEGILHQEELKQIGELIQKLMCENQFNFIMNFRKVRHLDYKGLWSLVDRRERLRAYNGDLKLVGLSPYLHDILRFCGVEGSFPVYRSEREAIRSFRQGIINRG